MSMKKNAKLLALLLPLALALRLATGAQSESPGYMTADETERYLTEKFQLNGPSRRFNCHAPVHLKTWTEAEKSAGGQADPGRPPRVPRQRRGSLSEADPDWRRPNSGKQLMDHHIPMG